MAPLDCLHSAAIDHGSAGIRAGVATTRRPPLDLQEIRRISLTGAIRARGYSRLRRWAENKAAARWRQDRPIALRHPSRPDHPAVLRGLQQKSRRSVFAESGNTAFPNRGAVGHYQAKARRYERRVFNIDGSALGRNIPHDAAHDGSLRRYIGRLVDFRPLIFSLLFHRRSALPAARG